MLDRLKLIQKISQLVAHDDTQKRIESVRYAQEIWNMLCHDQTFLEKHRFWHDSVNDLYSITPFNGQYVGCSIDGSQIYPDRHSGYDYFLINIGGIVIRYGDGIEPPVSFIQEPYIFSLFTDSLVVIDWVNAQRYAYELDTLVKQGLMLKNESKEKPLLLLLDGSLIFWHLEGFKDKNSFISLYNDCLLRAYDTNLIVVAYISKPKSKDLVALSNLFISEQLSKNPSLHELCNGISDIHLLQGFLPPGYRTTIFLSPKSIQSMYQPESIPCFFYCNVYSEIVRIELPLWATYNRNTVSMVASLILDQVQKGNGYPLIIAEAHHHAVVKKDDRNFFYYALEKESKSPFLKEKPSQKQQKKNTKYF
jgi:hypothetical protein